MSPAFAGRDALPLTQLPGKPELGCMRNLNYWMTSKRCRLLNIRDLRQYLTLFVYLGKTFHSQERKHLPANRCWNCHKFQPNKKSKSTLSTFSGGFKPHEATEPAGPRSVRGEASLSRLCLSPIKGNREQRASQRAGPSR